MYFVDIVVSYDFLCFCAATEFLFLSFYYLVYCLPLMLVNKVDHKVAF